MILAILIAIGLLGCLRIGYEWGKESAETIAIQYARTHPFRFTFDLVDDLYPDKADEFIHVKKLEDFKRESILEEHWGVPHNRNN